MPASAEIPHADEALKTLVRRFKAAPGSSAFTELAAALLARGHASEALRITEHGLQLVPGSVEGRLQRAAALLAQGRPRMAYVELLRALAIEPHHRRAQRLLGKAYVDAGAPERAAALLAQRSAGEAPARVKTEPTSNLAAALVNDLTEDGPRPPEQSAGDLPELFSALTEDLGLGAAVPEAPAHRPVEVTQVIRRKARPRPPRSASELAEIEGPIVDTSHPPATLDPEDEPAPVVTTRSTVPIFAANPDLASLALDDEPLFHEHTPFSVRPVNSPAEEPTTARGAPPPSEARTNSHITDPAVESARPRGPMVPPPGGALRSPPPPTLDMDKGPYSKTVPTATEAATPEPGQVARVEGLVPIVERNRAPATGRLDVKPPPGSGRRWLLAFVAALAMGAYFVAWLFIFGDTLSVWWTD